MLTIRKRVDFDAAHHLPNVPDGHKCKRLHGHTYSVDIWVGGELDPLMGWVVDYQDITDAWGKVHGLIDHRCLNDIEGLKNPTTELLALWIFMKMSGHLPGLQAIEVFESTTTSCRISYKDIEP